MKSFKKRKKKENFIIPGLDVFSGIGDFFIGILDFIKNLDKIIMWVIKSVIWLVRFIMYLVFEIFNPVILFRDIAKLSLDIPRVLIEAFILLKTNISKYMINNFLGSLFNNIFGWDSTIEGKNNDCHNLEDKNVSVTQIISTILLPPLGIFMKFGLNKWEEILLTGGLTMIFYFPGLIYALIKIYS